MNKKLHVNYKYAAFLLYLLALLSLASILPIIIASLYHFSLLIFPYIFFLVCYALFFPLSLAFLVKKGYNWAKYIVVIFLIFNLYELFTQKESLRILAVIIILIQIAVCFLLFNISTKTKSQ